MGQKRLRQINRVAAESGALDGEILLWCGRSNLENGPVGAYLVRSPERASARLEQARALALSCQMKLQSVQKRNRNVSGRHVDFYSE
jgi:hypothetical protein